jgi:hypothetical protein
MQELTDSIKRPNRRIMGIEEGEEVQEEWMHNILKKIITEKFQILKKYAHIGTGSLQNSKQNWPK